MRLLFNKVLTSTMWLSTLNITAPKLEALNFFSYARKTLENGIPCLPNLSYLSDP